MFTGLIQDVGEIAALDRHGEDVRLRVKTFNLPLAEINLGDSIAINGVCLTVSQKTSDSFWADVSIETMQCTTFSQRVVADKVNLEKSLTLSSAIGGHLVSGHVDGVARVLSIKDDGCSKRITMHSPNQLMKYIAKKGSICIDGISLTVNEVDHQNFQVNIVPHTMQATTMASYVVGREVNLEVDMIARYVERLLLVTDSPANSVSNITPEFLAKHGFFNSK